VSSHNIMSVVELSILTTSEESCRIQGRRRGDISFAEDMSERWLSVCLTFGSIPAVGKCQISHGRRCGRLVVREVDLAHLECQLLWLA